MLGNPTEKWTFAVLYLYSREGEGGAEEFLEGEIKAVLNPGPQRPPGEVKHWVMERIQDNMMEDFEAAFKDMKHERGEPIVDFINRALQKLEGVLMSGEGSYAGYKAGKKEAIEFALAWKPSES